MAHSVENEAQLGGWSRAEGSILRHKREPVPTAREKPAVGVVGRELYAVGGWGFGHGYGHTLEVYVPATGQWRSGPRMPTARDLLAAAAISGEVYVVGRHDGDAFSGPLEIFGH